MFYNKMDKSIKCNVRKRKVLVLGKLRTTQLIEADFQMLMRIFVNEIMAGKIK